MDDLADRYADRGVTSVFIYTREAHPAENYRHHRSMDDKRRNARAMVAHTGLRRRVLLDDLSGTAHHGYNLLPNMSWIVGRNIVLYKAAWTEVHDIENALRQSLDGMDRRQTDGLRPLYTERVAWRPNVADEFRKGLERNGPQAVEDFYK